MANAACGSLAATPTIYLTARSPSLVQQDRAHDGTRAAGAAHGRNGPRSEDGLGGSRTDEWPRIAGTDWRRSWSIGTAGTTAAGAIDPLPGLANFCRRENLWFHVDAAWGGAAVISPLLRHHLAGIEAADSITCDAHKWFSVPMGAGHVLLPPSRRRCRGLSRGDVLHAAENISEPVTDPYTNSVQWSRRFIGLKLFLALAQYGESGYVEMIEHQTRMGDVLRESLKRAGGESSTATPLPLVCFTRDGLDTTKFLAALHRAADRVDVGSPAGQWRPGPAGMHHQFSHHRVGHRTGSDAR